MAIPSVRAYDHPTGENMGLEELRGTTATGQAIHSQAIHETPHKTVFYPFYDTVNATRVVTTSDALASDFLLKPLPNADIINDAVDVSDASVLMIYGSISFTGSAEAGGKVVVTPMIIDENDEIGPMLPPVLLRYISAYEALNGVAPSAKEHVFRTEEDSKNQYPFHMINVPTYGARRIALHVSTENEDFQQIIIHATKTSFAGMVQPMYEEVFLGSWGSGSFNEYDQGV